MIIVGVFEPESETFQNRNYRQHLDRNWKNGNDNLDAVNHRIDGLGDQEYEGANEVTNARTDANGKSYRSLSGRLDASQKTGENALAVADKKADTETVRQMINQIVSGRPKGAYRDLNALKAALPNGDTGIYVTSDNGHWYYYTNGSWNDGGKYVTNMIAFEDARIKMPKINLLTGTTSKDKTLDLVDMPHPNSTASNGKFYKVQPNTNYTYHAIIKEAPAMGYVMAECSDKNKNVIKRFNGNHFDNDANGLSVVTFNTGNDIKYVSFYPVAFTNIQTGTIRWACEMLEYGTDSNNYIENLSEMNSVDALSYLFNLTQDRTVLNDLKMYGMNLLQGTSSNFRHEAVVNAGHNQAPAANGTQFEVDSKQTYSYHAYLGKMNSRAFAMAEVLDSNKKVIKRYNGTSISANHEGLSSLTFKPEGGSYVNFYPVAFPDAYTGDMVWKEEMLEYGDVVSTWKPTISEMPLGDSIAYIVDKLNKEIYSPVKSNVVSELKLSGINLLAGTSDLLKSLTFSDYNSGVQTISGERFLVEPNTIYTYHVNITKAPINCYALIQTYDLDGKMISRINGTKYLDSDDGLSKVTFSTGKDVKYVKLIPVAFSNSQENATVQWKNEMLEYGDSTNKWTASLSEMSDSDAMNTVLGVINRPKESSNNPTINPTSGNTVDLPVINVSGDAGPMINQNVKSVLPFTLTDKQRKLEGFVEMSWQGNSSLSLPKKGFKFKAYKDAEKAEKLKFKPTPLMYESHSFQLKAYYTNMYHINDLAAAEILSWFIASNDTAPDKLLSASHFGTISGTPCLLYFNDEFYGLATLKTKRGADLLNTDESDPNQIILENNGKAGSTWTTATPVINGDDGDFTVESDNDTNAQQVLNTLAKFVVDSTDEEFVKNVDQHFNVTSMCDYVIFNYLVNNTDAWTGKNEDIVTYDGQKWYMIPYDFDSSMGSRWQPGKVTAINWDPIRGTFIADNLIKKILNLLPDKLLARYNDLEQKGVLNVLRLQDVIDRRVTEIGQGAYEAEWAQWSDNPAYKTEITPDWIKKMFIVRKKQLKNKIDGLQK